MTAPTREQPGSLLVRPERSWRKFIGLGLLFVSIVVLAWLLWYGVLGQSDA